VPVQSISTATRWWILIVSLLATLCAFTFINGVAFVIPMLESKRDTNLAQAGLLASMPSAGMVLTLFGWGYLLDRIGERIVLSFGMALTGGACFAAASMHSLPYVGVFLFLGGMAAACANTASGRLVAGWFPAHQRGLVMGIRQTAQPLGIALGAMVIPRFAQHGLEPALKFPAMICTVAAVACALGVLDPPRPPRTEAPAEYLANPYRGSSILWRLHVTSATMMVPQCVIATFMLVWLIREQHLSIGTAGAMVTLAQLLGAAFRVAAGRWSDRVGSRLRPIRTLAAAGSAAMLILALTAHLGSPAATTAMITAAVITVLDNGLASTAIAEVAGPFWSGRALGAQNTSQRLTAAAAPPLFGALTGAVGYPLAFAACAGVALLAFPLVPVSQEARQQESPESRSAVSGPTEAEQ